MRFLAVGDIHNDSRAAYKLAQKALEEEVDLAVFCGDITIGDGEIQGIIAPFTERGIDIAMIPGNHDSEATIQTLLQIYKGKNLHGYSFSHKDVGFFGCGGGSEMGPVLCLQDTEIGEQLEKAHSSLCDVRAKIMVTHMHPSDSIIERMSYPGSNAIREAIRKFQPDIHICGHIHEAGGIEETLGKTKVVGVGISGRIFDI